MAEARFTTSSFSIQACKRSCDNGKNLANRQYSGSLSFTLERKRYEKLHPFACVTGSQTSAHPVFETSECNLPDGEKRMRCLFNKMSNGRGRLGISELQKFAEARGLPDAYVKPFYEAMMKQSGPMAALAGGIEYSVFQKYVSSREAALKRSFDTLDRDGNGRISKEELRIGLSHVLISCPNSRCTYKTHAACVASLLDTMGAAAPECSRKSIPPGSKDIDYCTFRHFFLLLPQQEMMVEYWMSADRLACSTISDRVPQGEKSKDNASPWGHLLAGATAGALSRTATAPLERVRLLAMTGSLASVPTGSRGSRSGIGGVIFAGASIVQTAGWRALYKGNAANVLRSAPQKALDFFAFDAFKSAMTSRNSPSTSVVPGRARINQQPNTLQTLVSAGLAGAVSSSLLYPLEVVRCRMSTDTTGKYRSIRHTFTTISRLEGVSALYRGLLPSVAAILPEAAITYGLFDLLKRGYTATTGHEATVLPSLVFGVTSAFTGQVVAYPLETVSRRMQASTAGSASIATALREILVEGGIPALYRGLGACTLRVIPMAIVSFGTYELVRMRITQLEQVWADHAQLHARDLLLTEPLAASV